MDEKIIWDAFRRGVPVILFDGCHINDYHNIDAIHWTKERVTRIRKNMEKTGIRPKRLHLKYASVE